MPGNSTKLQVLDYTELPDPAWNQGQITDTRNAAGARPFPLMYLWIFERPDSMCTQLVAHGWACLGPVHLLVSPEARVDAPVMRSSQDIGQAMERFASGSGRFNCPRFIDFEKHHSYLGYPINYLWCQGGVWQEAFHRTAERCDRYVVDLTTDERPTGLLLELEYLFNRVAVENIILLLDTSRADLDLVRDFVLETWAARDRRSANPGADQAPPPLVTYKSFSFAYLAQATRSQWTGKSTLPLASRAAHYAGWV
jgi:hypothetical protein